MGTDSRNTVCDKPTPRILIVDDHPLLRAALKQVLVSGLGDIVVGEADSDRSALRMVQENSWAMVILDMVIPGRGGLEVLQDIKALRPALPVLILTACVERDLTVRALREGAAGFVSKTTDEQELVRIVQIVLQGGRALSNELAQIVALDMGKPTSKSLHEDLSNREFEVLCLLGAGLTPSEIAIKLSLGVKTVNTYRGRLFQKMGMKTNAQLMRYAIKNNLTPP
jgi:DNA-binding NarL/FixJ family response regulator